MTVRLYNLQASILITGPTGSNIHPISIFLYTTEEEGKGWGVSIDPTVKTNADFRQIAHKDGCDML